MSCHDFNAMSWHDFPPYHAQLIYYYLLKFPSKNYFHNTNICEIWAQKYLQHWCLDTQFISNNSLRVIKQIDPFSTEARFYVLNAIAFST